jgi:hypothetical protein
MFASAETEEVGCFHQAYAAVQESGASKGGKWAKDFRGSLPLGHTLDPLEGCVSLVARTKQLKAAGLSRFEPNPLQAIAEAEQRGLRSSRLESGPRAPKWCP